MYWRIQEYWYEMDFPAGLNTRDQVGFFSAMIDYFLVWEQFA